ncbi:hypothetical protein QJQ45_013350 [Haematococcus lacustris]|nr:hypothetical protein QJQ45_013350 [Haematococcus lacustris]
MGLDPGAIQAVSAASGVWREDGCLVSIYRSKLTRSRVQHESGLIQARRNTQRLNDNVKLQLQHLAAITQAGTSLVAIQRHGAIILATWDAVWGEYLHPKWPEQKMRLCGAQEVLERYLKVVVPRLVMFCGKAGIGTRGGWGPKAVLQACRKVVERANSGRPTDQGARQDGHPWDLGKWVDRDCNAALNNQRAGESKWSPLELCRWKHRARLPAEGKEYPALGFKQLRDRAPKAQTQQPLAEFKARRAAVVKPHQEPSSRAHPSDLSVQDPGQQAPARLEESSVLSFKTDSSSSTTTSLEHTAVPYTLSQPVSQPTSSLVEQEEPPSRHAAASIQPGSSPEAGEFSLVSAPDCEGYHLADIALVEASLDNGTGMLPSVYLDVAPVQPSAAPPNFSGARAVHASSASDFFDLLAQEQAAETVPEQLTQSSPAQPAQAMPGRPDQAGTSPPQPPARVAAVTQEGLTVDPSTRVLPLSGPQQADAAAGGSDGAAEQQASMQDWEEVDAEGLVLGVDAAAPASTEPVAAALAACSQEGRGAESQGSGQPWVLGAEGSGDLNAGVAQLASPSTHLMSQLPSYSQGGSLDYRPMPWLASGTEHPATAPSPAPIRVNDAVVQRADQAEAALLQAQAELAAAQAAAQGAAEAKAVAEAELQASEDKLRASEAARQEQLAAVQAAEANTLAAQQAAAAAKAQLSAAEAARAALEAQLSEAETARAAVEAQLRETEPGAAADRAQAQSAAAAAQAQLDAVERSSASLAAQLQAAEAALAAERGAAQSAAAAAAAELGDVQAKLQAAQAALTSHHSASQAAIAAAEAEAEARVVTAEAEAAAARAVASELQSLLAEMQQRHAVEVQEAVAVAVGAAKEQAVADAEQAAAATQAAAEAQVAAAAQAAAEAVAAGQRLQEERDRLAAQLAVAEEEQRQSSGQALQQALQVLQEGHDQVQQRLVDLQHQAMAGEKAAAAAVAEAERLRAALDQAEARAKAAELQLSSSAASGTDKVVELEARVADLQAKLRKGKASYDKVKAAGDGLKQEADALRQQLAGVATEQQQELVQHQQERQQLQQQVTSLQQQLLTAQQQAEEQAAAARQQAEEQAAAAREQAEKVAAAALQALQQRLDSSEEGFQQRLTELQEQVRDPAGSGGCRQEGRQEGRKGEELGQPGNWSP